MGKAEGKEIVDLMFNESCDHADDGYCDRCIKEYLPGRIDSALQKAREEEREKILNRFKALCGVNPAKIRPCVDHQKSTRSLCPVCDLILALSKKDAKEER